MVVLVSVGKPINRTIGRINPVVLRHYRRGFRPGGRFWIRSAGLAVDGPQLCSGTTEGFSGLAAGLALVNMSVSRASSRIYLIVLRHYRRGFWSDCRFQRVQAGSRATLADLKTCQCRKAPNGHISSSHYKIPPSPTLERLPLLRICSYHYSLFLHC